MLCARMRQPPGSCGWVLPLDIGGRACGGHRHGVVCRSHAPERAVAGRATDSRGDTHVCTRAAVARPSNTWGGGGQVDFRGTGRPKSFVGGCENEFHAWPKKLEAFVISATAPQFRAVMNWAGESAEIMEAALEDVFGASTLDEDDQCEGVPEFSNQLHVALPQLTGSEPFDILQNCGSTAACGPECWRRPSRR